MNSNKTGAPGYLLSILSTVTFLVLAGLPMSSDAADMGAEIAQLNKDFNGVLGYPIMIVDKEDFHKRLAEKNLAHTENERTLTREIYFYAREKHGIALEPEDAAQLAPYFGARDGNASAMPFFTDRVRKNKLKYCVVLPNGIKGTHLDEVKRIIGADGQEEYFQGLDIESLQKQMSQEELQLFSLYHELSHCLDQRYLPGLYESEVDPHNVHLAESFAEVNALLLLSQRRELQKLGAPRSLLRTVYAKHYGPAIAQRGPKAFELPVVKAGGSIYFLAPVLMAGQSEIDRRHTQDLNLNQTIALSQMLVDQHALQQRSFQALHMQMLDGAKSTISHYQMLARKSPRHFLKAYQDLLYLNSLLESLQFVL